MNNGNNQQPTPKDPTSGLSMDITNQLRGIFNETKGGSPNGPVQEADKAEAHAAGTDSGGDSVPPEQPVLPHRNPLAERVIPSEPVITTPVFEGSDEGRGDESGFDQVDQDPDRAPTGVGEEHELEGEDEDDGNGDQQSPADSIKNLRRIVNDHKDLLRSRDEELEQVRQELSKYQTGEAVPDVIQELNQKLDEAEKYRKIVDLKSSREYQSSFVKPMREMYSSLMEYAKEYGLDQQTVNQLVNTENSAQINQILSRKVDPIGGIEVKKLVMDMHALKRKANEAEADPANSLERLVTEAANAREDAHRVSTDNLISASKQAWTDVSARIHSDGVFVEMITRDDDPDFNEKWAKPLQKHASTEYGKMIKMLAEHGLTNPPKELLQTLSWYAQLAAVAPTLAKTRNELLAEIDNREKSVKRNSQFIRPKLGGGAHAAPAARNDGRETVADGLKRITNEVLYGG